MVNSHTATKPKKSISHLLGLNSFFFLFSNFYINIIAVFFSVLAFIFYVTTMENNILVTSVILGLGYYFSQFIGFTFIEHKQHKHHKQHFAIGNRPKLFNLAIVDSFANIVKNFLAIILNIVGLFIILLVSQLTYPSVYFWVLSPIVIILVTMVILSSATFIVHKNIKGNLTYSFGKLLKFNLQNVVSYILNFVLLILFLLFLYFLNFSFNYVIESSLLLVLFSLVFTYVYFNSLLITIQPQIDREFGED